MRKNDYAGRARNILDAGKNAIEDDRQRINAKTKAYLTNPFVKMDGSLANPYIDYRKIINAPATSAATSQRITQATGIRPAGSVAATVQPSASAAYRQWKDKTDSRSYGDREASGGGQYENLVGRRIADTHAYNNSGALGQCVWYVRGRANEKLGISLEGLRGNGNQMWTNAKPEAKLSADPANLKANTLVSYKRGTSAAGQKYGHVIYIEDVIGDTVYYTEGGSGYYKNGTDGVVKTATREQIMQGVNSSGGHIGSGVMGIVDLSKY